MSQTRSFDGAEGPEVAGLAARRAALDILTLVRGGASLDEALDKARSFDALEGADRGFARALATVVLRRQGALDHLIGAYLDRPLPKRAGRAMDVLRLAGAQVVFLETPDHAAVSTAVALVKSFQETEGYAGLVNAIARKLARQGQSVVKTLPDRVDTPGWMWRAWERTYGPAATKAIAAAHAAQAPLDLTLKSANDAEQFARDLGGAVVLGASVRLREWPRVESIMGYDDGAWWVQDAAAALPARLLGDVSGKRVFDLCAAPGGKTLQLAARGARVVAVDIAGARLKRLLENLQRTGLSAETVKADVLDWTPDAPADAVLLDAPCSATGTIRRHPDILRQKSEDDVAALVSVQRAMIDRAADMVRPGGVLVYAVCSLQREEGEAQAEAALKRRPDLKRIPVRADEIDGFSVAITRSGDLRTLPSHLAETGGLDGFFAARFEKVDDAA